MRLFVGRSRGFGFLTFATQQGAQKAIDHGSSMEIGARKVNVNLAKQRESRPFFHFYQHSNSGSGGFKRDEPRVPSSCSDSSFTQTNEVDEEEIPVQQKLVPVVEILKRQSSPPRVEKKDLNVPPSPVEEKKKGLYVPPRLRAKQQQQQQPIASETRSVAVQTDEPSVSTKKVTPPQSPSASKRRSPPQKPRSRVEKSQSADIDSSPSSPATSSASIEEPRARNRRCQKQGTEKAPSSSHVLNAGATEFRVRNRSPVSRRQQQRAEKSPFPPVDKATFLVLGNPNRMPLGRSQRFNEKSTSPDVEANQLYVSAYPSYQEYRRKKSEDPNDYSKQQQTSPFGRRRYRNFSNSRSFTSANK